MESSTNKEPLFELRLFWLITLVLVTPSLFYLPSLDYITLPRELFWVTLTALFFMFTLLRGKVEHWLKIDTLNMALIVCLVWSLISSLWAWEPQLSWMRWTMLAAAYLTFVEARELNKRQVHFILAILAIQGTVLSVLGFLQSENIEPFSLILQTDKPGLTMGHRNVAAEYILMTFGVTLVMVGTRPSWRWLVFGSMALLQLGVLLEIVCRGVLLGMVLSSLCILFVKSCKIKGRLRFAFPLVLLAMGLFSILYVQLDFPGLDKDFVEGKLESVRMRQAHYSNTLVMIKESLPTGVGLGNFAIQYSQHLNDWIPDIHYSDKLILKNTHSDPLEALAELGPVGLILMAIVVFIIFFRIPFKTWLQKCLAWTLLAQLFNSMVNFPFQVVQTQLLLAILLGILTREHWIGKTKLFLNVFTPTLKILLCVLMCFFFRFQYNRLRAECEARHGLELLVSKRHAEAVPHLRQSVAYSPRNVDHIMLLAYCLREMEYLTESSSLAENVLGIFPGYLPAHNLIGINAIAKNDLIRAVKAFERSHELQAFQKSTREKLATAYIKLAQSFRQQGYFVQALELEQKLTAIKPELTESHYRQILDALVLKKVGQAAQVFEGLPEESDDVRYYFIAAKLSLAKNEVLQANDYIDKGLKIKADDERLKKMKAMISSTKEAAK